MKWTACEGEGEGEGEDECSNYYHDFVAAKGLFRLLLRQYLFVWSKKITNKVLNLVAIYKGRRCIRPHIGPLFFFARSFWELYSSIDSSTAKILMLFLAYFYIIFEVNLSLLCLALFCLLQLIFWEYLEKRKVSVPDFFIMNRDMLDL
jgi:hypothetical protein